MHRKQKIWLMQICRYGPFHNEDDPTVSVNSTKDYISMINSFNPSPLAKMTLWPTGGHNAWTKASDPTYKEDNLTCTNGCCNIIADII
ncbi:MAG: hypothetical protein WDO19_05160 [Bacteroidota bacterium]